MTSKEEDFNITECKSDERILAIPALIMSENLMKLKNFKLSDSFSILSLGPLFTNMNETYLSKFPKCYYIQDNYSLPKQALIL